MHPRKGKKSHHQNVLLATKKRIGKKRKKIYRFLGNKFLIGVSLTKEKGRKKRAPDDLPLADEKSFVCQCFVRGEAKGNARTRLKGFASRLSFWGTKRGREISVVHFLYLLEVKKNELTL